MFVSILTGLLLLPLAGVVSSVSVHSINAIAVLPQGDFADPAGWELSSQSGYSSDPAEYTQSMVADQRLSFTHVRSQNMRSMTFWSQGSSTGHSTATSSPDGVVATSSGPEIVVSGFDFSSLEQYPLINSSLVVAFRITDGLSDDRVEFSMTWNGGAELVKTYSNTVFQGELDYLSSPYATYGLDAVEDWSWTTLTSIEVKLNYESQPPDDAELQIDAVGLIVSWQAPESGFDFMRAVSDFSLDDIIDYTDPELYIAGTLSGSFEGLNSSLSWLRLSIDDTVVADISLSDSTSLQLVIPLSNVSLPTEGSTSTFGIGVRLFWDSDGSPQTLMLTIEDVTISGATSTEWDYDPVCNDLLDRVGDDSFIEDESYLIEPVISTCSDDRTQDLILSASTQFDELLSVVVEDGHLKVFPVPDAHGLGSVDVSVTDAAGNIWSDTLWIDVLSVNDLPMIVGIPSEVWIELGDFLLIEPVITDTDTALSDLDLDSNRQLASIQEDFSVLFTPTSTGVTDVTLTLWDGIDAVEVVVRVNAYSDPDLLPSLVYITPGSDEYSVGDIIEINVIVENAGSVDATFISVRCYSGQELIGNQTLAIVYAYQTTQMTFDWEISGAHGTSIELRVVVDSTDSITESDEENNELAIQLQISQQDEKSSTTLEAVSNLLPNASLGISLLIAIGIVAAVFLLGPSRIQRAQ